MDIEQAKKELQDNGVLVDGLSQDTILAIHKMIQKQVKKEQKKTEQSKKTEVTLGEYKGHSMVNFTGNFRPFSLSVAKAQRILQYAEKVQAIINQVN